MRFFKTMTKSIFASQPLPQSFRTHVYEISFTLPISQTESFEWLLKKKTFSSGQLPPYKVEFLPENKDPLMKEGDYTNHHGPWIQFAGVMTKISSEYRRLDYLYGSYALTFRLIRPLCLEVWTHDLGSNKSKVTLKLTTGVRNFFVPIWNLLMNFFWPQFALNAKILWFFKNLISKS